jgi:hypothetical protein
MCFDRKVSYKFLYLSFRPTRSSPIRSRQSRNRSNEACRSFEPPPTACACPHRERVISGLDAGGVRYTARRCQPAMPRQGLGSRAISRNRMTPARRHRRSRSRAIREQEFRRRRRGGRTIRQREPGSAGRRGPTPRTVRIPTRCRTSRSPRKAWKGRPLRACARRRRTASRTRLPRERRTYNRRRQRGLVSQCWDATMRSMAPQPWQLAIAALFTRGVPAGGRRAHSAGTAYAGIPFAATRRAVHRGTPYGCPQQRSLTFPWTSRAGGRGVP